MPNTEIRIEITALDRASAALDDISRSLRPLDRNVRNIEGSFDGVDRSINRSSSSFGRFKGLLAGAITVAGITSFTQNVVEATARAEDLKTTLNTVTGSVEAGSQAFSFINDFATRTPFDIETLTETFIKLQAAGITPTEQLLTTFGDAASVTTDRVGTLQAITDLFSRTTAGGLGLEELNRLADRGIPVYDILNEKLGVTRLEVSELGKTMEGADTIKQALLEGLNEDFGGGMEVASNNLSVSLSNMGIAANNALIAVGEGGLGAALNEASKVITELFVNNEDLARSLGESLGNAVMFVVEGFKTLIERASEAQPLWDALKALFSALGPILGILWETLLKIVEALTPLVETLAPVAVTIMEALGNVISEVVVPAIGTLVDIVQTVIEWIDRMINMVSAGIAKVQEMGSAVSNAVGGAKDRVVGWAEDSYNGVTGWFGNAYDYVVGNSVVPDLVNDVGLVMSRLPREMIDPTERAVRGTNNAFDALPVGGVSAPAIAPMGGSNVNSAINFNISGINAGTSTDYEQRQMRQFIEGVALQVANEAIRKNTRFGGLR